ncbi:MULTISPECIES: SDR family oxidoreductase [Enterobacterales]|uniref:SDR family oxidoreductase n=1 Tax=Enterobacterales TaxID=91347 RepID=UPI0005B5136A|nr:MULTISPECIES: SDR family oxidoreductase [Providencia]HCI97468.1 SDR family NAD(P)-dependent oxidoreductase [Providencia sp.]APC13643.1 Pyridoxal 4-dehydrogenase [Providencia rettgeri]AVL72998.1 SDR family NAD(P)-dependent oxidoreductase [Providencia rettgeri]EJD6042115.1 SDR family oxidoreductase [Providencia rettgeri]EJD6538531.1 SDR family oxidoreductase [Providencia rettgeri]
MRDLLVGKRIVITGAARGLGFSFAQAAAQQGAHVVLCDILEQRLQESVETLRNQGLDAQGVQLDLASPDSIAHAFDIIGQQGVIDGLINNAALATGVGGKLLDEYDIALWDNVMTVNVRGTWLVTKAALPFLKLSGHGKIVNIASDTALWGAPKLMAYVASKGAIISMTRSMARELGTHRICVNAIAPGLTKVEATEYVPAERHQLYENGRALQGEQIPEDVTGTALYLLSPMANFVTGQLIPVNGGFVFN